MKLLYYFLTKYLWSGSNTDTIFQIFFCFRKLLYYILRNNLSKAGAAEILCEQSGPGLGWFGADTSPISLIFISFMKLLNYFFYELYVQNCRGSNIWWAIRIRFLAVGCRHLLYNFISFFELLYYFLTIYPCKSGAAATSCEQSESCITSSIGKTNPIVVLIKSLKFFSMEWEVDGSQFFRSGGGPQREGSGRW